VVGLTDDQWKAFEFEAVRDQAAAIAVITTKLSYEEYGHEVERPFEFRLINLDSKGKVHVRGQPDSNWFILNWSWLQLFSHPQALLPRQHPFLSTVAPRCPRGRGERAPVPGP
jgi:hypothetical protein